MWDWWPYKVRGKSQGSQHIIQLELWYIYRNKLVFTLPPIYKPIYMGLCFWAAFICFSPPPCKEGQQMRDTNNLENKPKTNIGYLLTHLKPMLTILLIFFLFTSYLITSAPSPPPSLMRGKRWGLYGPIKQGPLLIQSNGGDLQGENKFTRRYRLRYILSVQLTYALCIVNT